uniref:Uncharacterized protein n=1 Tax=Arundo donax TaxID=35708 RepID=A0A0A9C9Y8_ARUDO
MDRPLAQNGTNSTGSSHTSSSYSGALWSNSSR